MTHQNRVKVILDYWFGDLTKVDLPSSDRTQKWFGGSEAIDQEIKTLFSKDLDAAIREEYHDWVRTAHGRLALIILLDQFTRNIYRNTAKAYAYDAKALDLCLAGIEVGHDHELTLMERVFFYLPLEHSEDIVMQERSLIVFKSLQSLSMPETRAIYDNFLQYALEHFDVIKKFGRFPGRNQALSRESTAEELQFLKQPQRF